MQLVPKLAPLRCLFAGQLVNGSRVIRYWLFGFLLGSIQIVLSVLFSDAFDEG